MTTPLTIVDAEGPVRGGVIVVQEAFGITDHIVDVCRRFAHEGYTAVAPHLFHRAGDPVLAYDDLERALPLVGGLKGAEIDADIDAAVDALAAAGIPAANVAIVGFCMGGTVAFYTAVRRSLGAAATFYGGGIRPGRFDNPSQLEVAGSLQTPWLGLYGDLDKGIPSDDVEELRIAAASAPVTTEIVRYAEAEHGFNCDDRPAVFNADAASDAWNRTIQWFHSYVKPISG